MFQGGDATSSVTLAWIQELSSEYYLITSDAPGPPDWNDPHDADEYRPWVVDVLGDLGIDRAATVGIAHRGGVPLEPAVHAVDRIAAAAPVAPAGFGSGTPLSSALARIVVLSPAYRAVPRRGPFTRTLAPTFSDSMGSVDDVVTEAVGQPLRTGGLQAGFPGPDDSAPLGRVRRTDPGGPGRPGPVFPRGSNSLAGQANAAIARGVDQLGRRPSLPLDDWAGPRERSYSDVLACTVQSRGTKLRDDIVVVHDRIATG